MSKRNPVGEYVVLSDRIIDLLDPSLKRPVSPAGHIEKLRDELDELGRELMSSTNAGYEPLRAVLAEALDQASEGKGKERHADGKPFLEQPIMDLGRKYGAGFLCGQADKRVREAFNCEDDERAIRDILGAINYLAAAVILRREG